MDTTKNAPAVASGEDVSVSGAIDELKRQLQALPSSKRLTLSDTEAIYSIAYGLVTQGRYADALKRFGFLTLYRPTEAKYLAGLALCNQMLGRYDEAVANFAFAANIEPGNPEHMLSIAECELLRHSFGEARKLLELVVRYCNEKGGFENTRERAKGMLALMDKRTEPVST